MSRAGVLRAADKCREQKRANTRLLNKLSGLLRDVRDR